MRKVETLWSKLRRRAKHLLIKSTRKTPLYPWMYSARRHVLFNAPSANNSSPRHFLTALPNPRAGIGHQLGNWIAGHIVASMFGCRHVHAPFSDPTWDRALGFGDSQTSLAEVRKQRLPIVRLPLFNSEDPEECALIERIIASYTRSSVLFLLEDDQFYKDLHLACAPLAERYAKANAGAFARKVAASPLRVAVHVRRGDVAFGSTNPNIMMRWIEQDYFVNVLQQLLSALDGEPAQIELFSQGGSDEFDELANVTPLRFRTQDGPIESFRDMAAADILITSKSSFSYKPALLGRGMRIVPANFWHGYPETDPLWVKADDRGQIDAASLAAGIAALLNLRTN